MELRVAVFGAGSWGTTVATLASRNAPTRLWSRRTEIAQEINEQHTNTRYLPGTSLPRTLVATDSIEEAVRDADLVVMGVPSHGLRAVLAEVKKFLRPWVPIVSLSKGLEQGPHVTREHEAIRQPPQRPERRAVLPAVPHPRPAPGEWLEPVLVAEPVERSADLRVLESGWRLDRRDAAGE